MAYKTFANGFPLPASDLNNFLMNQSVIVFADSAARTTAIPSPVQGMLTYLVDTSAYESWNGSAFVALAEDPDLTSLIPKSTVTTAQDLIVADGASSVTRLGVGTDEQVLSVVSGEVAWADAGAGGGMELLSTTSLSSASVTLSSIPQTYKDLKLYIKNFRPVTDGMFPQIQFNSDTSNHADFTSLSLSNFTMSAPSIYLRPGQDNGTSTAAHVAYINSYSQTETFKPVDIIGVTNHESAPTNSSFSRSFGSYGVDAITSITISSLVGNMTSGTALLYGVN
jgi:hypothetical protein